TIPRGVGPAGVRGRSSWQYPEPYGDQAAFLVGLATVACMSITRPTMLFRSTPSLVSRLLIMLRLAATPIAVVLLSLVVFCIESAWRSAAAACSLNLPLVFADAL